LSNSTSEIVCTDGTNSTIIAPTGPQGPQGIPGTNGSNGVCNTTCNITTKVIMAEIVDTVIIIAQNGSINDLITQTTIVNETLYTSIINPTTVNGSIIIANGVFEISDPLPSLISSLSDNLSDNNLLVTSTIAPSIQITSCKSVPLVCYSSTVSPQCENALVLQSYYCNNGIIGTTTMSGSVLIQSNSILRNSHSILTINGLARLLRGSDHLDSLINETVMLQINDDNMTMMDNQIRYTFELLEYDIPIQASEILIPNGSAIVGNDGKSGQLCNRDIIIVNITYNEDSSNNNITWSILDCEDTITLSSINFQPVGPQASILLNTIEILPNPLFDLLPVSITMPCQNMSSPITTCYGTPIDNSNGLAWTFEETITTLYAFTMTLIKV